MAHNFINFAHRYHSRHSAPRYHFHHFNILSVTPLPRSAFILPIIITVYAISLQPTSIYRLSHRILPLWHHLDSTHAGQHNASPLAHRHYALRSALHRIFAPARVINAFHYGQFSISFQRQANSVHRIIGIRRFTGAHSAPQSSLDRGLGPGAGRTGHRGLASSSLGLGLGWAGPGPGRSGAHHLGRGIRAFGRSGPGTGRSGGGRALGGYAGRHYWLAPRSHYVSSTGIFRIIGLLRDYWAAAHGLTLFAPPIANMPQARRMPGIISGIIRLFHSGCAPAFRHIIRAFPPHFCHFITARPGSAAGCRPLRSGRFCYRAFIFAGIFQALFRARPFALCVYYCRLFATRLAGRTATPRSVQAVAQIFFRRRRYFIHWHRHCQIR